MSPGVTETGLKYLSQVLWKKWCFGDCHYRDVVPSKGQGPGLLLGERTGELEERTEGQAKDVVQVEPSQTAILQSPGGCRW